MANLPEDNSAWIPAIYQLEETDPVEGGPGGVDNLQSTQLGNRTAWLKARALAALRMEDIKPISGTYNVTSADIGQVLSVHVPTGAVINLPPLAGFPKGNPLCIVVAETGTGSTVALNGSGGNVIENYLNSGDGVVSYTLIQGSRIVLIATETSWVIVLKSTPVVVTSGFAPGDVKFTAAPASVPQPGFLLCQGQIVSRTTYADLFAAIGTTWGVGDALTTFQLPDYRDRFPRIHNGGNGHDVGRVFGSYQADSLKDHTHTVTVQETQGGIDFGDGSTRSSFTGESLDMLTTSSPSTGAAAETRPINAGVNGWIKY